MVTTTLAEPAQKGTGKSAIVSTPVAALPGTDLTPAQALIAALHKGVSPHLALWEAAMHARRMHQALKGMGP